MSRTGRRPGTPDTRDTILAIARRAFATRGYDATSLRGIAAEAKVDPALVIHYFGTQEGLLATATGLPAGLSEVFGSLAALPAHDFARALVRSYLQLVDSDRSRNAILALVRSAVSNDKAAAMLREFLTAEPLPVIARRISHPDAQLRASPAPRYPGRTARQGKPRQDCSPGARPRGDRVRCRRFVPLVVHWLRAGQGLQSRAEKVLAMRKSALRAHVPVLQAGPRLDPPRLRDPAAADRWTWIVIACYAQLYLARPLAADLRLPWQRTCPPGRLPPARVRRGFRRIRQMLPGLAGAPKPGKPGPGRPPGSKNRRPATRHDAGKTAKRTEPKKKTAGRQVK